MSFDEYRRLRALDLQIPRQTPVSPAAEGASDLPHFTVLCRKDAYVDYIARVEAKSAEEAAERTKDNHTAYNWDHRSTAEFDARLYVTLDSDGWEIEGTEIQAA